jgi:hypothetical protein
MLVCTPTRGFQVDVMGEMLTEVWEQAQWCLRLDNSGMRVYYLILGLSDNRARSIDHLEEVVG